MAVCAAYGFPLRPTGGPYQNQTTTLRRYRPWLQSIIKEFGSGFCRLATRRLKRHNRVEFYKDAMPLDLLISIQDGAGYAFNSIDLSMNFAPNRACPQSAKVIHVWICFKASLLHSTGVRTLRGNSFSVRVCAYLVWVYQRPITACGQFMHFACSGYFHGVGDRSNHVAECIVVF